MNPVIGLDISKGKSDGQVFLDKGQPFGHPFCFQHVIQYLEEHGILFLVVNPLLSHQAKKSSLRKVKTDAVDAFRLCELYYKEEFEDHKKRGVQLLNLRHLTRQYDSLTQMYVQVKLQFQAVLDQVFPDYRGIFGDLYSRVSLQLLEQFTTPSAFQVAGEANIANTITCLCPSRSDRWADEKASLILAAAANNPFQKVGCNSHLISLVLYIDLLLQYQEHLLAQPDAAVQQHFFITEPFLVSNSGYL